MSALWAETSTDIPADRRSAGRPARPRVIQGGAGTARLGRVPFVLALIVILGVGMAGLLALNTGLQGQAFQARSLNQKANQLTYQEAALHTRVAELRSADNLATRAFKLGMRPDPDPGFIQLPNGKMIGNATTVTGNEVPMFIKTPEQIKAERKARAAKRQADQAKAQAAAARRAADRQTHQQTSPQTNQHTNQTNQGGRG